MLLFALALATVPVPAPAPSHVTLVAVARAALDDPTIVAIFDAANTYDIEASNLALRKSTNADVKSFATMLVKAHTDARQQGRDLARKLGVTPTPPAQNPLAPDHMAAMKKLQGLSGKAFDHAYLENEVAYHKAVLGAVTTVLMPAIQNQQLKDFVTKVGPVFQQHQIAAQQLLDKTPA